MSINPYHVRGEILPEMLGRKKIVARVIEQLTKPNPEHLSVVGPLCCGKSVLLKTVAEELKDCPDYPAVVTWDFRRHLPRTDREFLSRFAELISSSLREDDSSLADCIDVDGEDVLGDLGLVFDEIWQAEKRVLVLMDGFDAVLAADELTRGLWDNMLDLARNPGLRLVTASRARLRELLKHNARPSIFWDIFCQTPVVVGAFEEGEFAQLIAPLADRQITFESSGEKEFFNETGGHPVLAAALLSRLYEVTADGTAVNGEIVKSEAGAVSDQLQEVYAQLWEDCCGVEAATVLGRLVISDIPLSDEAPELIEQLVLRGLAKVSRNVVRNGSRMFGGYVRTKAPAATNLAHLFAQRADLEQNIRSLLQLRLAQIGDIEEGLRDDVARAIRDLVPEPRHALGCLRGIALKALELIWRAEFGTDGLIPETWINQWKFATGKLAQEVVTQAAQGNRSLPPSTGRQCGLLNLATGNQDTARVTKHVSRQTYLLLDHLQSAGDYGQHHSDPVSVCFAAALCLATVELAAKLAEELPPICG